jgi:hypothetical protein
LQTKTKIVSFHTAHSKPVKQEVNCTVILPPLVFPVSLLVGQANPTRGNVIKNSTAVTYKSVFFWQAYFIIYGQGQEPTLLGSSFGVLHLGRLWSYNNYTKLKRLAWGKRSCLLRSFVNYVTHKKVFMTFSPGKVPHSGNERHLKPPKLKNASVCKIGQFKSLA